MPISCQAAFESCIKDSTGRIYNPTLIRLSRDLKELNATLTGEDDTSKAVVAPLGSIIAENKRVVSVAQKLESILKSDHVTTFMGKFNSDFLDAGLRNNDAQRNIIKQIHAQLDSCPKIRTKSGAEISDPECANRLRRNEMVEKIAANDVFLHDIQEVYLLYISNLRKEYSDIDVLLADINYDANVKTQIYLDQLVAAQSEIVTGLQDLVLRYSDATHMGAMYIWSLRNWDKRHP